MTLRIWYEAPAEQFGRAIWSSMRGGTLAGVASSLTGE